MVGPRRPGPEYDSAVDLILAAAPYEDFARDNSPILALVVCAVLALLVIRLIVKNTTRLILLSVLLLVSLFIALEHENITQCTQTCKCTLAGVDTSIAYCNPKLPRF